MAEGAGHWLFDDHLAKLAHDQEGEEAGNGVAENHRRSRRLEHPGRAQEQAGTDGAAQRDKLDVAVFQAPFERPLVKVMSFHPGNPQAILVIRLQTQK
ncbi:hypothetical protein D3C84_329920 [compost metagenome]